MNNQMILSPDYIETLDMFIHYNHENEQARKRARITLISRDQPIICSSCNEEGHSRSTSRLCRLYSPRMFTNLNLGDVQADHCTECLSEKHSSNLCPVLFYANNPEMSAFKIAQDPSKVTHKSLDMTLEE